MQIPLHGHTIRCVRHGRQSGDYRSEERNTRKAIRVSGSANRTTEAWKFGFSSNLNYNDSRYVLSDGETYVNVTRNYSNSGQIVKSLILRALSQLCRERLASQEESL